MNTLDNSSGALSHQEQDPVRYTRWFACSCWGITLGLIGGFVAFVRLNHLPLIRIFTEFILEVIVGSLALGTVGTLIVIYRPRNRIGWLFCASGIGLSLTGVLEQYTRYALVTRPGSLPYGTLTAWFNFWLFIPILFTVLFLVPLLFPDGRLPSPRWRPALGIILAAIAALAVSTAFRPGPIDASLPEVNNPLAPPGIQPFINIVGEVGIILTLASLVIAIAAPIVRMRRAQGIERQQIKWFAYGSVVLVASFVIPIGLAWPNFTQNTTLSGITLSFGLAFLPAAVGIAILRYHLYDIDLIIHRTLVYVTLTVSVVAVYILVVGYLGFIFGSGSNLPISLVATGVVAVLFQPLREWLQRGVSRLLYGERSEPYTVLSRLGQRLEAALDPREVLFTVVSTLNDALKLPYTAVALAQDDDYVIAHAEGSPAGEPLHIPLAYQGKIIGQLIVSPRAPGETWTGAERRLLGDLAHQAGIAVHGVQVMTELQLARERLVLAREEERRRLRRGLHDDLAPSLAGFALTTAAASELIVIDPRAATEAIVSLHQSIRTTIANLRRLIYDLRPPTLDELGLTEAIRELASRCNTFSRADGEAVEAERLHVRLEVPGPLPTLSAAAEVAVYRIVQEALLNVTRHAQAQTCLIQLACLDPGTLSLKVIDDGIGLPAENCTGVGMSSMRERAAELGGLCKIERAVPTGTQVVVSLPILAES